MRLLDLYCGAGGAAVGYDRAGFTNIVGVDIKRQKRYPYTFEQADALEFLTRYGHEFDGIHASPPCQTFVPLSKHRPQPKEHKDWLTPTEIALQEIGMPHVIENVMTSPLAATVVMCGSHFGLKVQRHRKFKATFMIPPLVCDHNFPTPDGHPIGVYGQSFTKSNADGKKKWIGGRKAESIAEARKAMAIDWMTHHEICEAIPPAYTEYIGRFFIDYIRHLKETKNVLPDHTGGPAAETPAG